MPNERQCYLTAALLPSLVTHSIFVSLESMDWGLGEQSEGPLESVQVPPLLSVRPHSSLGEL